MSAERRSIGRIFAGLGLFVIGLVPAVVTFVGLWGFMTEVDPALWMKGKEAARMPVSVVVLVFTGLIAAYGVKMIRGELKKPTGQG